MKDPRADDADTPGSETGIRTWPPEKFYWTISEAPLSKPGSTARQIPLGLLEDLSRDVPASVDELHAVAAVGASTASVKDPFAASRTIIIAAPRQELEQARAEGALEVVPSSVPEFASHAGITPRSLNLLVGDLEPGVLKARRTRAHVVAACIPVLLAGLISAGLLRRAEVWDHRTERARNELAALHAAHAEGAVQSRSRSMVEELDRVRRINQAAVKVKPPSDAALSLAELLNAWPVATNAKPLSLSLTASDANLAIIIDGDPSGFLKSFKPPIGWSLDEPRISTVSGAGATSLSRVGLHLKRVGDRSNTSQGAGQ